MKKTLILIFLCISITLIGYRFDDPKYIHYDKKSTPYHYTNEIYKKITNNEKFTLDVFDTNLYKKLEVNQTENGIINNFISSLSLEAYSDNTSPSSKEVFQIRITFEDAKYIIKVYNEEYVAIYPWDGYYEEDIINMKEVPIHYNLYDFCLYMQKLSKATK